MFKFSRTKYRYLSWGAAFGFAFPVIATFIQGTVDSIGWSLSGVLDMHSNSPLLLIIDTAPFFLGLFSYQIGVKTEKLVEAQEAQRREAIRSMEKLSTQNAALRELNEALDGLVYTASHDLKTPVVNFKSMLNMLRTLQGREGSEKMKLEIMDRMDKAADKFQETISDLLNVSRVERQFEEQKEVVDIAELVGEITTSMEERIKSRNARIEVSAENAPQILFPRHSMESILQNLLTNAVKYTPADRAPDVKVRTYREDDDFILEVADNGMGIDLERFSDKLFRMFTRLHNSEEGTGIGLYIVKRIVENAEGEINVQSTVGEGTTFTISIPNQPANYQYEETQLHHAGGG